MPQVIGLRALRGMYSRRRRRQPNGPLQRRPDGQVAKTRVERVRGGARRRRAR
jgi:hypothetical protein